jgi:hypothetical protein
MSPQAQWELAKLMSVEDLKAVMQGQSNRVSQSIAMSALPLALEKVTADKGLMASQQLAQNPGSVNSRMLQSQQSQLPEHQGIGTLRSDNMGQVADVAMGAQGGVVGFAGGGDVQHFQVGGNRKLTAAEIAANDYYGIPAGRSFNDPVPGTSLSEKYGSIYNPIRDAASRFFSLPKNKAEEEGFVTAPGQMGISKEDILNTYPAEEGLTQLAGPQMNSPAAATTPPIRTGRPQSEAAPVSASGIKLLPTQPALPMMGFDDSVATTGTTAQPAAAQPAAAQPTAPAGGIKALGLASDFEAAQKMTNDSTKPYMDEMNKLAKGISLNEGEKESQKYTRAGTALLTFSEQLLASGRPGASSVGAALGKMGALAQEYAKEDTLERKAAIGSKMSLLGAQVQVAQHNTKSAIDFYQNAQKMAFDGIKFDAEKVFKQEELRLTKEGLDEKKAHNQATEASKKYEIDMQAKWRMAHIGVLGAAQYKKRH